MVEIHWSGTVERIRLDLSALAKKPKQRIATNEYWKEEAINLSYRPRASYISFQKGLHYIELHYREEDLKHYEKDFRDPVDGWSILFGVTRLSLVHEKGKWTADAEWACYAPSAEWDGGASRCKVTVERPSKSRAVISKARSAQEAFKKGVLKFGTRCEISEEEHPVLLEAAHVHEVKHGGSDNPENGLLLAVDLHRLFDAGLLEITTKGVVHFRRDAPPKYKRKFHGKELDRSTYERIEPFLKMRHLQKQNA